MLRHALDALAACEGGAVDEPKAEPICYNDADRVVIFLILYVIVVLLSEASEYELKAVLYNLAKFTQWPQGEQKTAEFINLCVTDQAVFDGAGGFSSKKIGSKHF